MITGDGQGRVWSNRRSGVLLAFQNPKLTYTSHKIIYAYIVIQIHSELDDKLFGKGYMMKRRNVYERNTLLIMQMGC